MDDYRAREDPLVAASHLGSAVRNGSFVLLLGAGVSRGVGLPDWGSLVERCCRATGVPFDEHRLTAVMDEVYEKGADSEPPLTKEQIVRQALYADLGPGDAYKVSDLRAPLLVGLGAVVMSGARTGSTEIFTMNFDDVLESYLLAHGFSVQVITASAFDIRGDVDVHIYHPHGYLPRGGAADCPDLVLSQQEFLDRLSQNTDEPWPASFISHLHGRTAIAVGLSFSDENLLQLLRRVRRNVSRRPLGYSLNVHSEVHANALRRNGIIPVQLSEFDEIPDYLLEIAKATATAINVH